MCPLRHMEANPIISVNEQSDSFTRKVINIGTSGWEYKGWASDFYQETKAPLRLAFYSRQFGTVEINATFYRLPSLSAVHGWRTRTPEGFLFAVKGSRYITHIKRLTELHYGVNRFFRRIRPLAPKIGPFLWQFPPNFPKDLDRLKAFLRRLPSEFSHAFEFRHVSWFDEETRKLLQEFNAALVSVSTQKLPADFSVTANFLYIRFHGLSGGSAHDYTSEELLPWANHIQQQAAAGRRVFAYFNNDQNVRAPKNARRLMEMCGVTLAKSTNRELVADKLAA
jgi:uncharacterized protein YecE (DUF72 family)